MEPRQAGTAGIGDDTPITVNGSVPASAGIRQRRALSRQVSLEAVLYGVILLLAVLTRFWDLGSRALHHDESLHAYYSWIFAEGLGYQHNPLMHGPFLFHANALLYLLLGSTDYVTRMAPALAGVIVVMLPWLLRGPRLLGRWGALSASALLLVSPSILYYSRFLRHDVYCLLGTFVLAAALLRYLEQPQPRWAILAGAAAGFLLCTKEVSFIVLFLIALFGAVAVAWRVSRRLLVVAAAALALLGVLLKVLGSLGVAPLPGIPWNQPTGDQIWRFTLALIQHPLVVGALGVGLLALAVGLFILDRQRDGRGWIDGILGEAPGGTTAAALRELLQERRGLLIGLGLGAAIFVVFYTSVFTNLGGLASGTVGALGYWLGQHDVQRGAQPWFYYLLLLPQYEFVAVLALPVGVAALLWRGWQARRGGKPLPRRWYVRGVLIYWALGTLAVFSWAGEKMPWLSVHVALPLTLLAASLLGSAIEMVETRWAARRRSFLAAAAGAVALLAAAFLALAWASAGPYVTLNDTLVRTIRPFPANHWWLVYLPWLGLTALAAWGIRRLGAGRALTALALGGTLALVLAQVHTEWRMTYQEGDVPRDMLIYVQTSPDVTRVTRQLEAFSRETTGGMGLEVWYDSGAQWPFNWYLRDFPNRRYFGSTLSSPPNAPIVLISQEDYTQAMDQQLQGYTMQQYVMRWWFPEAETYRRFAYAPELNEPSMQNYQDNRQPPYSPLDVARSVGSSLWAMREPREQAKIFRLVAFRELPAPIGTYWFRVYVRNDLVRQWDGLQY